MRLKLIGKDEGLATILRANKAFSLMELVISLGIFSILLVIITNIIVMNLKVAMSVKARSRVREETAFMLNVFKKDIRNAESVRCVDGFWGEVDCAGGNVDHEKIELLLLNPDTGLTLWYQWDISSNIVQRVEKVGSVMTYRTPGDVTFDGLNFLTSVSADRLNWVVQIKVSAWTNGMYGDPSDRGTWIWMKKESAVSTRNF